MLIGIGPIILYFFSYDIYTSANYDTVTEIIILGYICINLGYYVSSFKTKDVNLNFTLLKSQKKIPDILYSINIKYVSIAFLGIGLIASLIFFMRAGEIPILSSNKENARVAALSVGGNGYFLYLMTIGMYGICLYAIHVYYNRKKLLYLIIFLLGIGILMTGTGSRRYVLWMCLYVFIVRHYLYKNISIKIMSIYSTVGLLFVNIFEMYRNPESMTTVDLSTTFFYRFIIYISNLEKVITAFIKADTFEYGSTFVMDIITALPGKQIDYQSWLKEVTNLEFEGFGIPPTLMGDLYINFGYPGIIIGCFLFGYIIRSMYNNYILSNKKISDIFIYIAILEIASKIITSGISAQSVSVVWFCIVIILIKTFYNLYAPAKVHLKHSSIDEKHLIKDS